MRDARFWMKEWCSKEYLQQKRESFHMMDTALSTAPKRVLDIGAGMAYEAQWLQEKYGCALHLLDRDVKESAGKRDVGFGKPNDFRFYQPVNELRKSWDDRGLVYEFVDANQPSLSGVFDLVYSSLSCGFHYPLDVYIPLIKEHTEAGSVLIFDIRNAYKKSLQEVAIIVRVLGETDKRTKCQVELK